MSTGIPVAPSAAGRRPSPAAPGARRAGENWVHREGTRPGQAVLLRDRPVTRRCTLTRMAKRSRVSSPQVAEPAPGLWSNAIRVGDVLHVSGMTSRANDGVTIQGANEYEQAKVIFAKIGHLVQAAGGSMADVAKITIYVTNMRAQHRGLARAEGGLHRRLPRLDAGRGERPREAGDSRRDRGDRLHRLEPLDGATRRAGSP